jgi:hypothetical protein
MACITGVGLGTGLDLLANQVAPEIRGPAGISAAFLALLVTGFVAGELGRDWRVLHGSLAAAATILVRATIVAAQEAATVHAQGMQALPPIDFWGLAVGDVVALTAGTLGGWISERWVLRPTH